MELLTKSEIVGFLWSFNIIHEVHCFLPHFLLCKKPSYAMHALIDKNRASILLSETCVGGRSDSRENVGMMTSATIEHPSQGPSERLVVEALIRKLPHSFS